MTGVKVAFPLCIDLELTDFGNFFTVVPVSRPMCFVGWEADADFLLPKVTLPF